MEIPKKSYKCVRCNLHGHDVIIKDHNHACPYLFCKCEKCTILSDYRTAINRKRPLDWQQKCGEENPEQYPKLPSDYQSMPQFLSNDEFMKTQLNKLPVSSQQTSSALESQQTSPTLVSRLKTDDGKGKRPKLVLLISSKQKQSNQEINNNRQLTPMSSSTTISQCDTAESNFVADLQLNLESRQNMAESFSRQEKEDNHVDQQMLSQDVSTNSSQVSTHQNLDQTENYVQQQSNSTFSQQNLKHIQPSSNQFDYQQNLTQQEIPAMSIGQQRVEPIQMSTLLFDKLNPQQNPKILEPTQFSTSIIGQPGLQQNQTIPSNKNGFMPCSHNHHNLIAPLVSSSQNGFAPYVPILTNHQNLIPPLNQSELVPLQTQQNPITSLVPLNQSLSVSCSSNNLVSVPLKSSNQNKPLPCLQTQQCTTLTIPLNQNEFSTNTTISTNHQISTIPLVSSSQNGFVLCPHNNNQILNSSVSSEKQTIQPFIHQDIQQLPKPVDSSNHFSLVQSQHFPANSSLQQDLKSPDSSKNQPSTTLFQQSSLTQQQPRKTFQLVSNYSNPSESQNEPSIVQLPQNQQAPGQPSIPDMFNFNNEQLKHLLLSQSLMIIQLIMNQEV